MSCTLLILGTTGVLSAQASKASEEAAGKADDPNDKSAAPAAEKEPTVVVAKIGDYVITKDELSEKLVQAIRPREGAPLDEAKPVTAEKMLRQMVADKAMIMDGRKRGLQNDEMIRTSVEKFEHQQLMRLLLQNELGGKISVDESQVERAMKANPKLTRERATMLLQRAAATRLVGQFYDQLIKKFEMKKVEENFAETAKIHQRLLERPAEPRRAGEYWIKNSQIRDELSEKEKDLVLATYKGGRVTVKDWFRVLGDIVPPRRPTDLNTPKGVEKLLDQALRIPIFVAEARARGYHRDEKLREEVRKLEDQRVFYKAQEQKTKGIEEPTAEEIKACFEQNKEKFADGATVKVDQIWCKDLPTAESIKRKLDEGADFQALKDEHSLQKVEPHNASVRGEGLFWPELSKGDPNQILGPLKGFHGRGVKWRIVKVLEKTPAKEVEFSEQLADRVKWAIMSQKREKALDDYRKKLLEEYPHEIFGDRIKGLDPVELAMQHEDQ
jgi:hypothetical protein